MDFAGTPNSPIIVTTEAERTGHPPGKHPLLDLIAEAVTREHVRAVSEYKRGEDQFALRRYRRILCADPNDRIALLNLVWLHTRRDLKSETAALTGRWALRQYPGNLRLKYLTGRTLFWRGQIGEAIPLLGATVKEGPDTKRAFSLLGEAVALRRDVADNPSLGGTVPAPIGPRLITFTRDMISLDHVLPVVWRWSETGTRDAVIVFFGSMPSIDWRVTAARSMTGVHVRTLVDIAPNLDIDRMLDSLLADASSGVVAFDKSNDVMARVIGGAARRHGAAFVTLPHGEEAFANKLTKTYETSVPVSSDPGSDVYDLSVHSSDFTIVKYGLRTGPHIAILGSARYCRDWLQQSRNWLPAPTDLPEATDMRLVLFLPKPEKIVDWRELERFLGFLHKRPGITLLVKTHPRRGGRHQLVRRDDEWDLEVTKTTEQETLTSIRAPTTDTGWVTVSPMVESSSLVEWADVIMALGTSVTWEAVAKNKPVLELSWCHGNRTTILPSTDMRCRDDVLEALDRITLEGAASFYPRTERDAFLKRFIEPDTGGGGGVLNAYVDALETLARRTSRSKNSLKPS